MRRLLSPTIWLATVLGLMACASLHPAATALCLPLKTYTSAEQTEAAAELQALPAGSALAQMIGDYGELRAADRACQSIKPVSP